MRRHSRTEHRAGRIARRRPTAQREAAPQRGVSSLQSFRRRLLFSSNCHLNVDFMFRCRVISARRGLFVTFYYCKMPVSSDCVYKTGAYSKSADSSLLCQTQKARHR
mmetsp:Transcript_37177/g.111329  ORF Transcript_37177/g.111329 Transcript_37177/m.111329 type:complete len:107 (-) Transcript_37177:74-394(-)